MTDLLTIEKKAYLTTSEVEKRRRMMDADVWLFIRIVTEHGYGFVERFHRPMAYMIAGDAMRLAACLNRYDSFLTRAVRSELTRRGIDWSTRVGIRALARLLRRVNDRAARSFAKTSVGLDVILGVCSANPNLSVGMASKSDPVAQDKMCTTIGKSMLTDTYEMYFSDRLFPKNAEGYITKKWIRMHGRGPSDQESIEARGINSQWTGNHYDWIYADDIVGTESGEASTEDALRWIATLGSLSKQEGLGGSRHIFNGTIYGAKDDNSVLVMNDSFLSLNIPIWKKEVPHTLANILVDGEPTLPEWAPLEAIRQERAETLSNPKLGAISWLRNKELSADEPGAFQFSAELLKRSKFLWVTRTKMVGNYKQAYRVIRRYLWTPEGQPKLDANLTSTAPCICWMKCPYPNHAYKEVDPMALPRMMAVDQAYVTTGDRWAIASGCQDSDGVVLLLKGAVGVGYSTMIPMIPIVYSRLGGAINPPRRVGIESNAAQGVTSDWLKRDNDFRFLARRIAKLSPGQTHKQIRIFNNLLANLILGTVLIDPDYAEFDSEALSYNPEESDPQDDVLDASSMVVALFGEPEPDYAESERRADEIRAETEYYSRVDRTTGIDLSDWVSTSMDINWN